MHNKRGLSEVVTNLLIILLVLVAIAVVWVVISNILSQVTSEIEIGQLTLSVDIVTAYVNGTGIIVAAKRNAGGGSDFTGINFIFDGAGDSIAIKRLGFLQEGATKTFIFTSTNVPGIGGGDEVSVSPIYNSSGNEKIGGVTDTATIEGTGQPGSGQPGGGAVCSNSIVETGETCDDGNTNGGDGCSATCQVETPASCDNDNQIDSGEYCDGTDLGGQNCTNLGYAGGTLSCNSNCAFDPSQCTTGGGQPSVCGNNIAEAGEQCDGTDLNGQSCLSLGFSGAPLTCNPAGGANECQFNTSQCSPPIAFCGDGTCNSPSEDPLNCPVDCPVPPTCNGVWEGASENPAVECDGTPLPNGCSVICTCEAGFTNNSAGSCDLNPPLNSGTILSIWNSIYFDSNDLPKNDSVGSYQNAYANFSGTIDNDCFLITLADYVQSVNRSYLRVEDTFGTPDISPGNGYYVWEAENCGQ